MPDEMTTSYDAASSTLVVTGEIDSGGVDQLARVLAVHLTSRLVLDLSAVTYLPSAAVGIIVRAQRRATAQGGSVDLVAAPGTIAARVLDILGLTAAEG